VRELIDIARTVTRRDIPVRFGARQPGDPPALVSDPALAHARLGWSRATRTSQTKWRMLGLGGRAGAALSSEARRSPANEAQTGDRGAFGLQRRA
jgi:hypothetical protein